MRTVYFFLIARGLDSQVADYILVALPTFFYFTAFSIIVVLWYEIQIFKYLTVTGRLLQARDSPTTLLLSRNLSTDHLLESMLYCMQYSLHWCLLSNLPSQLQILHAQDVKKLMTTLQNSNRIFLLHTE